MSGVDTDMLDPRTIETVGVWPYIILGILFIIIAAQWLYRRLESARAAYGGKEGMRMGMGMGMDIDPMWCRKSCFSRLKYPDMLDDAKVAACEEACRKETRGY